MGALTRFFAILVADLRQRTRSTRFWVMLAIILVGSWYCFPSDDAGYMILALGHSRGYYSSAWVGMVLGLVLSVNIGLAGFYLVRGTLVRDFETRVWQLLVATPMTRGGFLLAKWASHMLVFSVMIAGSLCVGLLAQWIRAEDRHIDLIELVKPALLLSLPSLSVAAAAAVWFDLVPWLRRTLGNVLYYFLWTIMLVTSLIPLDKAGPEILNNWRSDSGGMVMVARDFHRVRSEQTGKDVGYGFSLGGSKDAAEPQRFEWKQWQPQPMDVVGRLLWVAFAMLSVLAATPFLDRAAARTTASENRKNGSGRSLAWLDRITRVFGRSSFGTLVTAELKLVLRQRRLWWWLLAIGIGIAQLAASGTGLMMVLCVAWLLPLDVLARTALRESDSGTAELVFTAPGILWRLLAVRFTVGLTLSLALILPGLLKLLLLSPAGAGAALCISVSMVAWGLAFGLLCRNPRLFELLALGAAYVGAQGAGITDVLVSPLSTSLWHLAFLLPALLMISTLWPRSAYQRARAHA